MGLIGKGVLRQEVVDGNKLVDTEENGGLLLTAENTRFLGRIHLVLNKTLMDDTSIKWPQIKTFFV